MGVDDLLDWIDRRMVSGQLTLGRPAVTRTFSIDAGYLTGAGSSAPREHLGHLLIRRGHLDDQAVDRARAVQAKTGVLLGRVLLDSGAVTEAVLRRVLEEKIAGAVFDALSWTEGSFQLDRVTPVPTTGYEIAVHLRAVLDEGLRRRAARAAATPAITDDGGRTQAFERARQAWAVAPDDAAARAAFDAAERALMAQLSRDLLTEFRVPRLLKSPAELEALELSESERYLVSRVDGRWDLLSLIRVVPLRAPETLITFKRLADRGILSL